MNVGFSSQKQHRQRHQTHERQTRRLNQSLCRTRTQIVGLYRVLMVERNSSGAVMHIVAIPTYRMVSTGPKAGASTA
jgi:hypothetical protein